MQDNTKLSIHHIGGRGGSRAFPLIGAFEEDIVNVLYDADSDCLAQIKNYYKNNKSDLHVLPYCLGREHGRGKIKINYDPYTSSLLPFNDEFSDFYVFNGTNDYVLSESIKTKEELDVDLVSLDSALSDSQVAIQKPDFLSLDIQGAEYDVLLGSTDILENDALAIVLEAEFHELYEGQKTFSDISLLLKSYGFRFINFLDMYEYSPRRAPIGFRGSGIHLFGEALFMKEPNLILSEKSTLGKKHLALYKAAFIALIFNQIELAIIYLKVKESLVEVERGKALFQRNYVQFVNKFEKILKNDDSVYPPTFSERYTYENSKARFSDLSRKPHEFYSFPKIDKSGLKKKRDENVSEVEDLFLQYGLKDIANGLKEKRVEQSEKILNCEVFVEGNRHKEYVQQLVLWHKVRGKGKTVSSFLKNEKCDRVIVYGAGDVGTSLVDELLSGSITIEYIVDKNVALLGTKISEVEVVSYDKIAKFDIPIVVAILHDADVEVAAFLKKLGCKKIYKLREIIGRMH